MKKRLVRVTSVDCLLKMTPDELTAQANLILQGSPDLLDEACDREIIRVPYTPRNLNRPLVYVEPKNYAGLSQRMKDFYKCEECGRPRSYSSGRRCRYCYILGARLAHYERTEGLAWLEYQGRGITMPDTEWWDEYTDIPARPTPPKIVTWNPAALDWRR